MGWDALCIWWRIHRWSFESGEFPSVLMFLLLPNGQLRRCWDVIDVVVHPGAGDLHGMVMAREREAEFILLQSYMHARGKTVFPIVFWELVVGRIQAWWRNQYQDSRGS